MMLSPQAARMGTVYTTLRNIGCSGRHALNGVGGVRVVASANHLPSFMLSTGSYSFDSIYHRFKATLAIVESDDESDDESDLSFSSTNSKLVNAVKKAESGFTFDAVHGVGADLSHDKNFICAIKAPWIANLGRDNNINRISNEWFTGVSPSSRSCPGTCKL
jgi:hypothetical protein